MSKVSSSETLKNSNNAERCFLPASLCVSPDVFSLFLFGKCLWQPLFIYCFISKIWKFKRPQICCIMIHPLCRPLCALCLFFSVIYENCLRPSLHTTYLAFFCLLLCYAGSAGKIQYSRAFLPSQSVFIRMFTT